MDSSIFSQIKQKTIEGEVANHLRKAIIEGRLALGTHLPEKELAEQMAVSRIPVREALRLLTQEGLVKHVPNRGCYVVDFTAQDVEEVFSLRATLECMSFDWAIPNLGEDEFTVLDEILALQEQAILTQSYTDLARLDMQFHEFICIMADHSRLLKTWYEQHNQCQILLNLRFSQLPDYTPQTVPVDHRHILEALREGDGERAKAITQEISHRVSLECIEMLEHMKHKKD